MADKPAYRFLPWTRRGLASAVTQPDLPSTAAHAVVTAGITVSGAGNAHIDLRLYGPGDIAGLDPRVIVRLEPRANVTDVEPNYVPAIEFDPPDFPWLFTPAAASTENRLRPWCVLVVVDTALVAPPHLERGAPLPVITVARGNVITELPDLAESWAWAHTQVLTANGSTPALRDELRGAPDRQLSRILCPRRLEPGKRYCACLVPAFAVGALRGLGGVPDGDAALAPAWNIAETKDVRLPVYYHWEFATGPQGDFESLARALEPFKCDAAEVGVEKMFIGAAGAGMPRLAGDDTMATVAQDGALRAPLASSSNLQDVPALITQSLRSILNHSAARDSGEDTADATAGSIGPPLYAQGPIDRQTLSDDAPEWFRALNLDPRARVAAGLGAEVVRANQEAFIEACWDQVGGVLDANEALSRARLALEAARRVHGRHFQPLPSDLLTQLASPLQSRVLHGAVTLSRAIDNTSMPNAVTDAAMRRLTSGQRPVLKKVARARRAALPDSRSARPLLARTLAAGRSDVDPSRFTPGGIVQLDMLAKVAASGDSVDLTIAGAPMQLTRDQLDQLRRHFTDLLAQPGRTAPPIRVRPNLRTIGLVMNTHLAEIDAVSAPTTTTVVDRRALVGDLLSASEQRPGAVSFLITVGNRSAQSRVDALDVDSGGRVVVRPATGSTATTVGTVSTTVARTSTARISTAITSLPPGTLDRRGRTAPDLVATTATDDPTLRSTAGALSLGSRTANTVAPPVRDTVVLQRFDTAFQTATTTFQLEKAEPVPALVSFDLAAVRTTLLRKTDPVANISLRTASRIRVAGIRLDQATTIPITTPPTLDRIMVAPSIVTPMYELLAEHDRSRLLPGVDRIPENSITLLETNGRFVAAFLAGSNHEMNRELLWRRYPTDQRGTTLRRFWDWIDDGDDIPPIHTWTPEGGLGSHTRGGDGGQLVLLVRGKLLRRYPNSVIYAWRAAGRQLKDPPTDDDLRPPVFSGRFPPDIAFVGFDLTFDEITQGDGWFFVIQQQPTEPRFGFDEVLPERLANPPVWSDATWADAGVQPGAYLRLAANPLLGVTRSGATFGLDAAHLAAVLLQKPMRVALHGSQLAHLR